uniref:Lipoma HMGIC fusion partner-like 1 protein n=1 Tax=Apis cerana TaxID=7461 RepID=V9IIS5_APICE
MTVLCALWATLSTVASILACSGFYLPYWIQGRLLGKADAYFGSFRRCNYPRIRAANTAPEIVYECARYSSFWDIPSGWWQASTVTMGDRGRDRGDRRPHPARGRLHLPPAHPQNSEAHQGARLSPVARRSDDMRRSGHVSDRMGQQGSAGVLREGC